MWYIFVSVSSFFSYCHNLKSIDVLTDISAFNVLKYILSIVAALDQIIDNVYHVGILLTFTNSENKVGYILEPIKDFKKSTGFIRHGETLCIKLGCW